MDSPQELEQLGRVSSTSGLDLVLGTTNAGKQVELREMLSGLGLRLHGPADLGLEIDVEESGKTFTENALLKARAYASAASMPAVADDSGLCVQALNGAPGVFSARFGGLGHSPRQQNLLVLRMLEGLPRGSREAEFVSVIAFVEPGGTEWTVDARVKGSIAETIRGSRGFGYDPIFIPDGSARTYAEMSAPEKNALSHRAAAVQLFRMRLSQRTTPGRKSD